MPGKPSDDDHPRTRAELERSLARKVWIWAETWRRCPRKGCRRIGACLDFDHCAGVTPGPVVFTEKQKRAIRRALAKAQGRERNGPGPAGGYDPAARERARLLPPTPPQEEAPSRTGRGTT